VIGDDQPGRYAQLGRMGELLNVILERLLVCTDCGAVIADTEVHDRSHREEE
jgi:hypothetical protein